MSAQEKEDYIFDFERLNVYQKGLEFVCAVCAVVKDLPPYLRYTIGGNFIRAAMSFINNIAEGSGKLSKDDKRRFYGYSLTSIREGIPSISVLHKTKNITDKKMKELRAECVALGKMIVGLIKKV
ncbi:MAG: four helix bundle protein [PVC group bacterium]